MKQVGNSQTMKTAAQREGETEKKEPRGNPEKCQHINKGPERVDEKRRPGDDVVTEV